MGLHGVGGNSFQGNVTCMLHSKLGLLVLPWYMVVCGEVLAQLTCSVLQQQ